MESLDPEFLDRLLALVARASSLNKGKVCSRASAVAQQHVITAAMVGYTLWRIRMPTEQPRPRMIKEGFVYDYITANSIVRSLYELYVRMHYLCVDAVPEDLREFRIWVWERHGEMTALKLAAIANDPKDRLEKNIAELDAKIRSSPHYPLLKDKSAQSALQNHGILRPLRAAAISSGIKERNWDFLYTVQSQFTHGASFHIAKQREMLREGGRPAATAAEEVQGAGLRACPILAAILRAYERLTPEVSSAFLDEVDRHAYRLALDVFDNVVIQ